MILSGRSWKEAEPVRSISPEGLSTGGARWARWWVSVVQTYQTLTVAAPCSKSREVCAVPGSDRSSKVPWVTGSAPRRRSPLARPHWAITQPIRTQIQRFTTSPAPLYQSNRPIFESNWTCPPESWADSSSMAWKLGSFTTASAWKLGRNTYFHYNSFIRAALTQMLPQAHSSQDCQRLIIVSWDFNNLRRHWQNDNVVPS